MLDINIIRNNPELIKKALVDRQRRPEIVDRLLAIDLDYRQLLSKVENLRSLQNSLGREIKAKPTPAQVQQGAGYKQELKSLADKLKIKEEELNALLDEVPNLQAADVPVGTDDRDNIVIKTVGTPPHFDFPPLDHVDLGEKLDIIDIKRAAKISGSRFGYFKNQAAVLEMALMFYSFQKLVAKGYTAMIPPAMVKKDTEWKMGYNSNKNLGNAYYLYEPDQVIFIPSSEHSVIPYHMDEILEENSLPLRFVNFSPCFRREAGTYGKDTRGLFRVHFFNKVEMNILSPPDTKVSDGLCQEMLGHEEELMQDLGLAYQVMNCCTGDLPQPNRRMYDINTWFPGQNAYRETQSCSNCTDYQARRLNTRVKIKGKNQYVHMLNATLITDRAVLAIIENFQTADGSVTIPKVLWPYTGFKKINK